MSTKVMPATIDSTQLHTSHTELERQNDHLWTIITQQKNHIRDLEMALARITKDHDLLLLRSSTSTTPATPPSPLTCTQEPVPPPRSPYRQQYRSHDGTTVNNTNSTTASSQHSHSSSTTECASTSSATVKTGHIHAILDKDAELFANYQKTSKGLTPSTLATSDNSDADGHSSDKKDDANDKHSNDGNSSNSINSHEHDHDHDHHDATSKTNSSIPSSQSHQSLDNQVMTATDLDTKNYASFSTMMALKVVEINIQHSLKNKEAITFIISVSRTSASCINQKEEELWRIKKGYSEFMALDTLLRSRLRSLSNKYNTATVKMGKLPAKSLFTSAKSANTNMDQKKRIIERYLKNAIRLPLPENIDLIQFLASGIFEQNEWSSTPKQLTCEKEGYISLYGKQSKKWHSYYFMLRGSMLDYYDSNDGPFIGSILLKDSQMTVQRSSASGIFHHSSPRSTVTITQTKRSLSTSKHRQQHLLRMESETELDGWIQALSTVIQPTPQVSRSECIGTSTKPNMSNSSSIGSIRCASHLPSRKRISNRILPSTTHSPPQRSQSDTSVHSGTLTPSITIALGACHRTLPPLPSQQPPKQPKQPQQQEQQQQQQQQQRQRKRSSIDAIFCSARRSPRQDNHLLPQETQSTRHTSPISALLPSASTSLLIRRHGNDTATKKSAAAVATAPATATKLNRRTFWPKSMFLGHSGHGGDSHGLRSFLSRHSTADHHHHHHLSSSSSSLCLVPSPSATTTTTRIITKPSRSSDRLMQQQGASLTALPMHPVFGVPLEMALQVSKMHGLPTIVYRCIQFLERKKAVYEEGIYRISGSTIKIKGLRRRFDELGDIDLLGLEEFRDYDVHAVSGLLKLWLRELPGHILTDHLIDSFILVKDSKDRDECIKKLHRLIFKLPPANYTLLRALMAHLHCVTRNANVNKMTLRNMGIVFTPTLGIPTGIFDLFLCEFDSLFMTRRKQQQQQHGTWTSVMVNNDKNQQKDKVIPTCSEGRDDQQQSMTTNTFAFGNSTRIARHREKLDRQSNNDQDVGDKGMARTEGMELVVFDPPRPMIKT